MPKQILRNLLEELIKKNYRQAFQKPVYSYYDIDQTVKDIRQHFHSIVPSEDEIKSLGIDLVEKHFPKHQCKERGAAIVLYAELIIQMLHLTKQIHANIDKE